MTEPGRFELWVARKTGDVLVWLARRAKTRGDEHQFRHVRAAVTAGNSKPCKRDGWCHLDCPSAEWVAP